uniref:Uncharacterized protein n=1 Tax=Glossina pallidipes TaxID=7398 RepID=A0A1B0AFR5_GLOPL
MVLIKLMPPYLYYPTFKFSSKFSTFRKIKCNPIIDTNKYLTSIGWLSNLNGRTVINLLALLMLTLRLANIFYMISIQFLRSVMLSVALLELSHFLCNLVLSYLYRLVIYVRSVRYVRYVQKKGGILLFCHCFVLKTKIRSINEIGITSSKRCEHNWMPGKPLAWHCNEHGGFTYQENY